MAKLADEVCEVCRVGAPLATPEEVAIYLESLPEWTVVDAAGIHQLQRVFSFSNFVDAIKFANRVGELAEDIGHHPKLVVEWGNVEVYWWTHKIGGLHKTDFVMAAKTDKLLGS